MSKATKAKRERRAATRWRFTFGPWKPSSTPGDVPRQAIAFVYLKMATTLTSRDGAVSTIESVADHEAAVEIVRMFRALEHIEGSSARLLDEGGSCELGNAAFQMLKTNWGVLKKRFSIAQALEMADVDSFLDPEERDDESGGVEKIEPEPEPESDDPDGE